MGVRRSVRLGVALTALLLMPMSGAAAAAGKHGSSGGGSGTSFAETLRPSGQIVYSWRGDPARGCAQVGVCGVHGSLVIQPEGLADVFNFSFLGAGAELTFQGVSADVRVQGGALGPSGTCVDQLEGDANTLNLNLKPGGSVTADFGGAVSSGHCAGPLAQDLERILIRGRRSRSRAPTYDLRGSLPFTAGPFSGTLTSTLVLSPQPLAPGLPASFVSAGLGSGPAPVRHRQLVEQVVLRYRVTAPATTFTIAFGGERGPFCHALNTCRAYGSLTLSLPRLQGDVDILATRNVKTRVGRRQALRDLRAGRLPVIGAPLNWVTPRLSETFYGGGTCAESLSFPNWGLGFGSFGPSRHALMLTVSGLGDGDSSPLGLGGGDPLRTHCPGPEAPDALAPQATLASARIPVAGLLRRQRTITLRTRGGFIVPGYDGTRNGELAVTMSLLKVIAGTQTETEISSSL